MLATLLLIAPTSTPSAPQGFHVGRQPPTGSPDTMSQPPTRTSSSSDFERIFNAALESYKVQTKKDLMKHDLLKQMENCDSPAAILAVLQAEAEKFDPSWTGNDDRLRRQFIPTANVLYAFSGTLCASAGLVNINSSINNITL